MVRHSKKARFASINLCIAFDSHTNTPFPNRPTNVAANDEGGGDAVTCGSVLKVQHAESGYFLNSEAKQLNTGSGQQLVTFVADAETHHTLWWIRPAHHTIAGVEYPTDTKQNASTAAAATSTNACQLAQPVPCGTLIRFTHVSTGRNLHSHGVESVLSKQQEVTAYGVGDTKGDGGDDWKVECVTTGSAVWRVGATVRLQHKDTGAYLGTSKNLEFNRETCGSQCPIMNHLEAFSRKAADGYGLLKASPQGVYLSK
jgi:dolichyl-phosphate-mannose--protein O-mannosyl transferase